MAKRQKLYPPAKTSRFDVEASTKVREELVVLSGKAPTAWERAGRKDVGDQDCTLWQRTYPSVTYPEVQSCNACH